MADQIEKIFVLTLLTFHTDSLIQSRTILEQQQNIQVLVGCSHYKQPEFYINVVTAEKTLDGAKLALTKKCMTGLTEKYKEEIEAQANEIYDHTIIRKLPTYLKKIAQMYPNAKNLILEQLSSNFPHKDRPQIVSLLVY